MWSNEIERIFCVSRLPPSRRLSSRLSPFIEERLRIRGSWGWMENVFLSIGGDLNLRKRSEPGDWMTEFFFLWCEVVRQEWDGERREVRGVRCEVNAKTNASVFPLLPVLSWGMGWCESKWERGDLIYLSSPVFIMRKRGRGFEAFPVHRLQPVDLVVRERGSERGGWNKCQMVKRCGKGKAQMIRFERIDNITIITYLLLLPPRAGKCRFAQLKVAVLSFVIVRPSSSPVRNRSF